MNCDCIQRIEQKFKGHEYGKNQIVEKATITSASFMLPDFKLYTNSTIEFVFETGKKKKTNLTHNYCPFCGVKIGEEEVVKPEEKK